MTKAKVLFLCTGNSARSQMAEGLLRHLAPDKFEVYSAGVNPTQVNPLAIKVMSEIGQQFDYVITVCDNARQTCPIFPGEYQKLHWSLEDPAQVQGTEDEKYMVFRKVRDQIKENILKFFLI